MKYCTRCGTELVDEAVVCTICGCAVVVKTSKIGKRFIVGRRKTIIVIFIILSLLFIIYVPVTYLLVPKPPANEDEIAQKAKEDSLRLASQAATKVGVTTEDTPIEFIVNISGAEDRFLKATVIFEYDEKNDKLGAELRKRAFTKYKDMLIKHMSSLSLREITDPSERDKICKDLRRMVNASLPKGMGEIRSVMFTNYITQ